LRHSPNPSPPRPNTATQASAIQSPRCDAAGGCAPDAVEAGGAGDCTSDAFEAGGAGSGDAIGGGGADGDFGNDGVFDGDVISDAIAGLRTGVADDAEAEKSAGGMTTIWPHLWHLARLPELPSGALMPWPH
jgi:hypothetical protein